MVKAFNRRLIVSFPSSVAATQQIVLGETLDLKRGDQFIYFGNAPASYPWSYN